MNTKVLFDKIIDVEIHYTEESRLLQRPTLDVSDLAPVSSISKLFKTPAAVKSTKKSLKITCPRYGKKPEISFEWSRVPEAVCYQCSLRVTNLYLSVDSAWVDEIIVNAGYASDAGVHTCKIRGTVFNSYTPTPGPDGYTVFDMLVAKAESELFSKMYTFTLYNEPQKWTVKDVLEETCSKMSCKFVSRLSKGLLDSQYSDTSMEVAGKTGYALLNDIQTILNDKVSANGNFVKTLLFDDTIVFAEFDAKGMCVAEQDTAIMRDVPRLDLISSADWNAGTLTIQAPWVPEIAPGSLFKCYPQYFKGSAALPNEVARQQLQRDNQDTYYVITQTVKFSTTQDNEMQILAVPLQNSPAAGENLSLSKEASNLEVSTTSLLSMAEDKESKTTLVPIKLGEKPVDEKTKDLTEMTLTLAGGQAYKVVSGDTLNKIAERYPPLKAIMPSTGDEKPFPASVCWFPVIMCLTNTAMKTKGKTFDYYVNMSNPDSIKTDTYLEVPAGITWKQIADNTKSKRDVAECMRAAADYYENTKVAQASYAGQLRNAAYALENWVVQ